MPKYEVIFVGGVNHMIKRLPTRVVKIILKFCSEVLADDPHSAGKTLRGYFAGCYSARRGNYRIIYTIDDQYVVVQVIRVGHRSVVYRNR